MRAILHIGCADAPYLNAFYYRNDYVGVEQ
jgi:hypothetical protein